MERPADEHPMEHRPAMDLSHPPEPRSARRPRTAWPVAFGIFALLLLVAFGARRSPGNETGEVAPSLNLPLVEALVVLGGLTGVFVVVLLLSALLAGGTSLRPPPRKEGWMKRTLIFMAVFAAVAFAFSFFPELEPSDSASPVAEAEGGSDPVTAPLPWKWLVLGVGLVGGLTVVWFATRRAAGPGVPILPMAEAHDPPADGPPDLWTYEIPPGDDPRSRVIQHYAAMEMALGQAGRPRFRSEAPFEYAERIARSLPTEREKLATLTRLFVRARFSEHDIDMATEQRSAHELAGLQINAEEVQA